MLMVNHVKRGWVFWAFELDTEGKFNFPIVHAIQKFPRDNRLKNILRQRTQDIEVKKYAIKLLEDAGSFEYTRAQMKMLDDKIGKEIEKLNGNDLLKHVMSELRNWDTNGITNGKKGHGSWSLMGIQFCETN